MEKSERQEIILGLIRTSPIGSQDELGEKLASRGLKVTQATLSRDLREIGIVKTTLPDGGFRYSALEQRLSSPIQSVQISGNLLVIRTESGMAPPVAYKIDDLAIEGVLGTVAGEDTLMLVVAEKANPRKIKAEIEQRVTSV